MSQLVNTRPNLIDYETRQHYNDIIINTVGGSTDVVKDNLTIFLTGIYDNVIKGNMTMIVIITVIIVGLYVRWKNIQEKRVKKDKFISMNPSIPVRQQINRTVYPARPIPLNLNNNGPEVGEYQRSMSMSDTYINDGAPYVNDANRGYYLFGGNSYYGSQPNRIMNPYHPYDFNMTTSDFMQNATDRNMANLEMYNRMISERNDDIVNRLNLGPMTLNDVHVDPPY